MNNLIDLDSITNGSSSVIVLLFLLVAVSMDLYRREIPNVLVALMLGCGIVLQASFLGTSGVLSALGGVLAGFMILIPFYALGGLGAGDVKLLASVGGFLGPWGVAVAGLATLLVGGVLGLIVILWQRVGTVLVARFFSIPPRERVDENEVKIPYSIAIAIGTVVAFG
jgi:prepilin peptidase CpaA